MRKVTLPVTPNGTEEKNNKNEEAPIEDQNEARQLQNNLPSEILQIIKPALAIGAFTGMLPPSLHFFSLFSRRHFDRSRDYIITFI